MGYGCGPEGRGPRCGGRGFGGWSKIGRGINLPRIIGLALMIGGGLTLMIFVPRWVWMGALAVVMICVGFLLWRFS